ncbi:MAG TPA: SET domain-containing protein-lysine N-methyltransferase [Bacteroidia bacterium]|nr:SET domain-containing protein-lysine N-methyltransferase [Bacteroidia bacterium]
MALIVKKSQIPRAGKGLFTTKPYKKDDKIIEYRGEIIGWKEYNDRVKRQEDGYLFYFNRKRCVDAFNTPRYKARYANDALGIVRVKGLRNNSHYEVHDEKCYIVAARNIKAGEEIFCDYTRDYWKCIRYNIRLKEKEEKTKKVKNKKGVKK